MTKLEMMLKTKETELSQLRLELATSQSRLEQVQAEVKKRSDESGRMETLVSKLQLERDNIDNKVGLDFMIIYYLN